MLSVVADPSPFFEKILDAPKFMNVKYSSCDIRFTISDANVSLANCIRRTILADIPIVVMRTSPYERNQCKIIANTSRFHNEIALHRLSCIPVYMSIEDAAKYELIVEVQNDTNEAISVTTEHFMVRNLVSKEFLSREETQKIFPPTRLDEEDFYIEFIRLRPRIGAPAMVPGEKIHFTCKFDTGTASENAAFNVVHKCHFTNTVDNVAADIAWEGILKTLRGTLSPEEITFKKKNFEFLDRLQYYIPGSFEFVIKTLGDGDRFHGHYDNTALMNLTCDIILERLRCVELYIDNNNTIIKNTDKTDYPGLSFDIVFQHEGYTIGKLLEYLVYDLFFRGGVDKKLLYCGFIKPHPHRVDCILRMVFISSDYATEANARIIILAAANGAKHLFKNMRTRFNMGEL